MGRTAGPASSRWGRRAVTLASLALAVAATPGCRYREQASEPPQQRQPYFDLVAEWRPPEGASSAGAASAASPSPASGGGAGGGETPRRDERSGVLYLPAGATAEYLLFVEPDSELRVERLSPRGAGAALVVRLETDADGGRDLVRWDDAGAQRSVELALAARAPARLLLRSEGPPGSGVALARPSLLAPAPAGPGREAAVAPRAATPSPTATATATATAITGSVQPNILVYLVDTLRPDRLGCYGYGRPTSPAIDAFAAGATLFENAVAQSSWTKAGVGSIFTSQWPPDHGALGWSGVLAPGADTLAERLQAAGYTTAAVVTNLNVTARFGFGQGFDHFTARVKGSSTEVNDLVRRWLDDRPADRPFFLYVHTLDPHAPYAPPEPWRGRFAPDHEQMPRWQPRWRWPDAALPFLSNLYDGEIAANDASFGALLAELRGRGLLDPMAVVLTSDHGEEFREHGRWRHGYNLHRETLNIPLVVKLPGQREGRREPALAQHVDLMPTLLGLAGAAAPPHLQGRDLLRSAAGQPSRAFAHLRLGRVPEQLALIDGDWKVLYTPGAPAAKRHQLYHWRRDPGERQDLAGERPIHAAVLAQLVHRRWSEGTAPPAAAAPLDEETAAELRSLGYVQ